MQSAEMRTRVASASLCPHPPSLRSGAGHPPYSAVCLSVAWVVITETTTWGVTLVTKTTPQARALETHHVDLKKRLLLPLTLKWEPQRDQMSNFSASPARKQTIALPKTPKGVLSKTKNLSSLCVSCVAQQRFSLANVEKKAIGLLTHGLLLTSLDAHEDRLQPQPMTRGTFIPVAFLSVFHMSHSRATQHRL